MSILQDVLPKGLFLGALTNANGLGVVPILAEEIGNDLQLDTLDKSLEKGTVTIREVSKEGEVPYIAVDNHGDCPLVILDGEELLSKELKQHRITNATVVVLSNTVCRIPVSCIERHRFEYQQTDMPSGQSIFRAKSRIIQKQSVTTSLLHGGDHRTDQRAIWNEVDHSLNEFGVHSPTADYAEARQHVSHRLEQIVQAIHPVEGQIGAVFIARQGVLGVEMVANPSLFSASHEKISRSFAFEAVLNDELNGNLLDAARAWWAKLTQFNTTYTNHFSPGAGQDLRVQTDDFIGSGLFWNGLVHFSCFPVSRTTSQASRTLVKRSSLRDRRRNMRSTIE